MDSGDDANALAALKQSILESEISLRELKETIETVDARLKRSRNTSPIFDETEPKAAGYLNAAGGGG